jgi:hypothetical protein
MPKCEVDKSESADVISAYSAYEWCIAGWGGIVSLCKRDGVIGVSSLVEKSPL